MTLNTLKCNHLTPLHFKRLNDEESNSKKRVTTVEGRVERGSLTETITEVCRLRTAV